MVGGILVSETRSDIESEDCQGPCGSVTMIDVFSLRLQARVRTDLKIQDERQRAKQKRKVRV